MAAPPLTFVVLLAGLVAPEATLTRSQAGVSQAKQILVAKRRKRRKKAEPALQAITIKTGLAQVKVKTKKRTANGIHFQPNNALELELAGPGRLTVVVYQALEGKQRKAKEPVLVNTFLDGTAHKGVSFKGKRDRRTRVVGPDTPSVSKAKSTVMKVPSGAHTVAIQVPAASTAAIVELQYFPSGSRAFAPIEIEAPSAPAPEPLPLVAEAEPEPALSAVPEAAPLPEPESPMPAAIAATPTEVDPGAALEARIRAGELRDGIAGDYPIVAIQEQGAAADDLFHKGTLEQPFTFIADGPGTVTLRAHRLISATSATGSIQMTVLENDVLLQSVDVDAQVAERHSVAGDATLLAGAAKEYKLKLGPKLSRFVIQLSESAVDGVALRYEFAPQDKTGAMALTLDLGDDIGMGAADLTGGTALTEVTLREKVVVQEVEKVIRVGGDEFIGIAVGGDLLAPQWRGAPAFGGGVELRLSLPFAERTFAVSVASSFLMQELRANASDRPGGASFETSTGMMLVPITAGIVTRFALGDSFGLYLKGSGGFVFVRANKEINGTAQTASAFIPAGCAGGGAELKLGPGSLMLEVAYLYAPATALEDVMDDYSPAGAPVSLRYRLGF